MKKYVSAILSTIFAVTLATSCERGDESLLLAPELNAPNVVGNGEFNASGFSLKRFALSFKADLNEAELEKMQNKYKTRFSKVIPQIGIAVAEKPEDVESETLANEFKAESTIDDYEALKLVQLEKTFGSKADPEMTKQYHLGILNAEKAWDLTMGKPNIKIAIVDSGIDLNHPDLKARIVAGMNIIEPKKPPMDDNGHGTHVAGIAAATAGNGIGVAGVAPNCSLMPVKALNKGRGTDVDIAEAIVWAADNGADVINISIGLYTQSRAMVKAVNYALKKNVVVISSAGNDSKSSKIHLPSMIKGVIEVSATNKLDRLASFSNYAQQISVSAPGDKILSTMPTYRVELTSEAGLKYGVLSGTSMASPMVAGLAALLKSQDKSMTPKEVKEHLEATSVDLGKSGYDVYFGSGRIDMLEALK